MCGRFTLVRLSDFTDVFPWIRAPAVELPPRYNIAPGQPVAAVLNVATPSIELVRWGLVPAWADDASIGNRMINARMESVASKPSFAASLRRRRCVIPASGFYEWRRESDGTRTPIYITRPGGEPLAFAGIWDIWHASDGSESRTCAIITVPAAECVRPIHDRMPAILRHHDVREWLTAGEARPDGLLPLLRPWDEDRLVCRTVSRLVNNPRNDVPECIKPVDTPERPPDTAAQPGLFDP